MNTTRKSPVELPATVTPPDVGTSEARDLSADPLQRTLAWVTRTLMEVRRSVASAIVVALALALAVAACGGGGGSGAAASTVPAGQWADTICSSLQRYDKATKQSFLVFQGLHLQFQYGVPKQSDVRDKQMKASAAILQATDQLIANAKAAGVPRTAHGQAFTDELVSALHELRDSVDGIHDQALSLPTGSDRADQGAELSPQIGAALEQLGKRLDADKATNGGGVDLTCGGS
jgi:hypothetical protein